MHLGVGIWVRGCVVVTDSGRLIIVTVLALRLGNFQVLGEDPNNSRTNWFWRIYFFKHWSTRRSDWFSKTKPHLSSANIVRFKSQIVRSNLRNFWDYHVAAAFIFTVTCWHLSLAGVKARHTIPQLDSFFYQFPKDFLELEEKQRCTCVWKSSQIIFNTKYNKQWFQKHILWVSVKPLIFRLGTHMSKSTLLPKMCKVVLTKCRFLCWWIHGHFSANILRRLLDRPQNWLKWPSTVYM